MEDRESRVVALASLQPNLSSAAAPVLLDPGCEQRETLFYLQFLESGFLHSLQAVTFTVNSSSSELNILSRSLKDTARSFSWMRLVEAKDFVPDGP